MIRRVRVRLRYRLPGMGLNKAERRCAAPRPPSPDPPSTGMNRLADTLSPYLLQHQDNPVDWYPWGDEAFEKARREDKPVFLSIGYATCHWCHVMEHESFEDDGVAALLNEHFVAVKVDREERPDVDALYMAVAQALTGRGGWPLTILMTPEKEPFFAGTYLPKHDRAGHAGLMTLLREVARAWAEDRARVEGSAGKIVAAVREGMGRDAGSGGAPDSTALASAYNGLAARFDPEWGGFGSAPKFPTPHHLLFLLRESHRLGVGDMAGARALHMAERTLTKMRLGGVYDHVGFGFHRYSTDRVWKLPHFEKMLYDQALLAMAYTEGWEATRNALFRQTAEEVIAYVGRDLTGPEGAFHSAEDADSLTPEGEQEEGAFYVWDFEELIDVLGPEDGPLAAALFGAERGGNFRDEATRQPTGLNVLHRSLPDSEAAEKLGMSEDALRERVESIRQRLFDRRAGRPRPLLDDKVLTDWNGLMIAALAKAARAFGRPEYAEQAARAADFFLSTMRTEEGRLLHRYRTGTAGLTAPADDYAFLAWGLVELYEAAFDPAHLRAAIELTETLLERFWDDEHGGLFLTPDDAEELLVRQKAYYDGAVPSANSAAAYVLVRLARLTGRTEWEDRAAQILASSAELRQHPSAHTMAMLALQMSEGPAQEVTVAGEPGAADTDALLAVLREGYYPLATRHLRPPGDAPITEIAPYTAAQTMRDGQATAYVCERFACRQPVTEPAAMREQLEAAVPS